MWIHAKSKIVAAFIALVMTHGPIAAAAQTADVTHGDRVAGQVVSALDAHPLAHATVTLRNYKSGRLVANTNADDDGHYSFESVAPGKYSLSGVTRGYFSAAYDEHEGFSTAIVTGAGLATDALTLRLMPLASLNLRVIDEAGDPVANAMVQLYREDPNEGGQIRRNRGGSTSNEGLSEFSRLLPGRYYLSASGIPWYAVHPRQENGAGFQYRSSISPDVDVAYPLTFYPHAFDSNEASPIEIHGGEQLALDMTLAAQHAETLSIRLPPGQRLGPMPPQLFRNVFGEDEPVMMQQVSFTEGEQLISGIAPGRYELRPPATNATPTGNIGVDLTAGSASMDMPHAAQLVTVSVSVHTTDDEPLSPQTQLSLQSADTGILLGSASPEKGMITFPNIPPGAYRFAINGPNRQLHPTRLVVDGHEIPGNTLRVQGTGTVKAELTVSAQMVDVDGFAIRDGKPAAGSMMVLVPAGKDTSEQLFRRDQSDLDGSFVFHGVVPGNYILVAIDNGWSLRWNDPTTLTPYLMHGVPVVVTANGKAPFHVADKVSAQPR